MVLLDQDGSLKASGLRFVWTLALLVLGAAEKQKESSLDIKGIVLNLTIHGKLVDAFASPACLSDHSLSITKHIEHNAQVLRIILLGCCKKTF